MLIDLYSNRDLSSKIPRTISYLTSRSCTIEKDISFYENMKPKDIFEKSHINSVLSARKSNRNYKNYFGHINDSHAEIEKLGVCKYCKKYTVIISLEDSLDYILHFLTGSSIENILNCKDYAITSRGILNLNYDLLSAVSEFNLLHLDKNLDNYLLNKYQGDSSTFISYLFSELIQTSSNMVNYIFAEVKNNFETKHGISVVPRSKSFSTIVLTSDEKLDDIITIRYDGKQDYNIAMRSFEKYDYFNHVSESFKGDII